LDADCILGITADQKCDVCKNSFQPDSNGKCTQAAIKPNCLLGTKDGGCWGCKSTHYLSGFGEFSKCDPTPNSKVISDCKYSAAIGATIYCNACSDGRTLNYTRTGCIVFTKIQGCLQTDKDGQNCISCNYYEGYGITEIFNPTTGGSGIEPFYLKCGK
jgi:hypothetical protein